VVVLEREIERQLSGKVATSGAVFEGGRKFGVFDDDAYSHGHLLVGLGVLAMRNDRADGRDEADRGVRKSRSHRVVSRPGGHLVASPPQRAV
jgi:hypothetical protein